ncbi:MAG: hypothetical protein JO103_06385 [Candidatus Eremiobacteraeota bacterium]|nr:hypothetical protein [Candidatus Eremiobacteraeota bacterium]MBV9407547.1 hypothetical protein [Candidatus Eremiobacteraeota bacterium]
MSAREGGEVRVEIGGVVVPASYRGGDLAARIEREIADRRFGPGNDPVVTAIAARLIDAIDKTKETR